MSFNRVVITTAAGFVLALGAPAAATAAGNATQSSSTPARTVQTTTYEQVLTPDYGRPETIARTRDLIVRVNGTKSGFGWGDAGIGAVAALGLSLVALASWLAASQRRARRTGSPATH
jgi:hypothetical protein